MPASTLRAAADLVHWLVSAVPRHGLKPVAPARARISRMHNRYIRFYAGHGRIAD